MSDKDYDLSRFKCKMCGACCKIAGFVRVGDEDLEKIASLLSLDVDAVIDRFTELAPDRQGLILKDRADGACVMLTDDNLCMINAVKPEKCRTFPYEWVNSTSYDYCEGLKESW